MTKETEDWYIQQAVTEIEIQAAMRSCVSLSQDRKTPLRFVTVLNAAFDAICESRRQNRELKDRLVKQARALEVAELDRDLYRSLCFGRQKGGAA